jgi:hypothetical protein
MQEESERFLGRTWTNEIKEVLIKNVNQVNVKILKVNLHAEFR